MNENETSQVISNIPPIPELYSEAVSNNPTLVADICKDSEVAFEYQKRKHTHWDMNYLLMRDRVVTNRLTQRQSVNVPIMAETYDTWSSNVDESPIIEYVPNKGNSNEEQRKALYWNAIYLDYYEKWKLDEIDAMDKKTVFIYGRSFKKLYWQGGDLNCRVIEPYDIELDPKVNPLDIETAMYLNHKNIFTPLRDILANPHYSAEGKKSLSIYLTSKQGKITLADGEEARRHQENRLLQLGVYNFDEFSASDIIVELKECYKMIWHPEEKKYVRHYIVLGANHAVLYDKPMLNAVGVEFLPFETWSDDPDLNDVWGDSKADRVRPINNVMNTWLSQMIENRTYRNFSMFFYDSTNPKYKPQSFTPTPLGMYPLPGKPAEVMTPIPIAPLTDSLAEMNYFKTMAEGVTAITSTEKGQAKQEGNRTLGEIQIDLRESSKRTNAKAKYYRNSWESFGMKFQKMLEANRTEPYELQKEGNNGELYDKIVSPEELKSDRGFKCKAKLKSEVAEQNTEDIKKLMFVRQLFPNNRYVQNKVKQDALFKLGWTPEDIHEAMSIEEQSGMAQNGQPVDNANGGGGIPSEIAKQMIARNQSAGGGQPAPVATPVA